MSNNVFQGVIQQLKEASDRVFGVVDNEGFVISCTETELLGERWQETVQSLADSEEQAVIIGQKTFRAIFGATGSVEYAVFCQGEDTQSQLLCNMAYIALNDAKSYYEEKHDRGTFVKNIIMDNILPGDI